MPITYSQNRQLLFRREIGQDLSVELEGGAANVLPPPPPIAVSADEFEPKVVGFLEWEVITEVTASQAVTVEAEEGAAAVGGVAAPLLVAADEQSVTLTHSTEYDLETAVTASDTITVVPEDAAVALGTTPDPLFVAADEKVLSITQTTEYDLETALTATSVVDVIAENASVSVGTTPDPITVFPDEYSVTLTRSTEYDLETALTATSVVEVVAEDASASVGTTPAPITVAADEQSVTLTHSTEYNLETPATAEQSVTALSESAVVSLGTVAGPLVVYGDEFAVSLTANTNANVDQPEPPVAVASGSVTNATLDGDLSASTDPDNDISKYEFLWGDSTTTGWQNGATAQHTYAEKALAETFTGGTLDNGGQWSTPGAVIVSDESKFGGYSLAPDGGGIDATWAPDFMSGGKQINSFAYWWWETSNQFGHQVNLYDASGSIAVRTETENPQWYINGQEVLGSEGQGYQNWTLVHILFDWPNDQFFYYIEDTGNTDLVLGSTSLLNPASNKSNGIAEVRFNDTNGTACRFDGFQIGNANIARVKDSGGRIDSTTIPVDLTPSTPGPDAALSASNIFGSTSSFSAGNTTHPNYSLSELDFEYDPDVNEPPPPGIISGDSDVQYDYANASSKYNDYETVTVEVTVTDPDGNEDTATDTTSVGNL
jgi:hypothetical protein